LGRSSLPLGKRYEEELNEKFSPRNARKRGGIILMRYQKKRNSVLILKKTQVGGKYTVVGGFL